MIMPRAKPAAALTRELCLRSVKPRPLFAESKSRTAPRGEKSLARKYAFGIAAQIASIARIRLKVMI